VTMWCVAPLEMNEGNSLGARVQSAYKAAVPKKPHTRPLTLEDRTGRFSRKFGNQFKLKLRNIQDEGRLSRCLSF